MEFGDSVRPLIEAEKQLDVRAEFVPDEQAMKSYLDRGFGNSYDFSQIA